METIIAASALALAGFAFAAPPAGAAGCLSGGAVGAAAGHFAGHHAVVGGLAGCAVGHHHANTVARHQREEQHNGIDQARASGNTGPQN
ncbi:MAG: hypothetical protein ABI224_17040 [Acetobacteraceae bacterium]